MHTPSSRPRRTLLAAAGVIAALLIAAGCTSSAGSAGWTYGPPQATPAGSPGASGSAAPGGSPTPAPSQSAAPSESAAPSGSATPAPSGSEAPAVTEFDLTETADLHIVDASGQPVSSLTVKKGQTYTFKITNTAGYDHDFYIGSASDLQAGNTANLTGVTAFSSGTKIFTYTFTTDGPLQFACTIPGHYQTMHGDFVIQP